MGTRLIVTSGTSSGLGEALFDALLAQNAADDNFLLLGRRFSTAQIAYSELHPQRVFLHQNDFVNFEISRFDTFLQSIFAHKTYDTVVFINNAGDIKPIGTVGSFADSDIVNAIAINLQTPIIITNSLARITKRLDILNISSGAANRAIEGWAMYCSAKAGAKMFFEVCKQQTTGCAITVEHIDPGVMDTTMQTHIRNTDSTVFPMLDAFVAYKTAGILKTPHAVAQQIVNQYFNQ
jgi:benzil reductase ((S)-benzoin forming)